jgi:hypothetical protein
MRHEWWKQALEDGGLGGDNMMSERAAPRRQGLQETKRPRGAKRRQAVGLMASASHSKYQVGPR